MTIDTKHFKELLEKELTLLESELSTVGRKNPDNLSDWETIRKQNSVDKADEGEVASGISDYENNNAVLSQLEIRLNAVKNALNKIENGNYGICKVGGEEIEQDRLEANPSAETCKLHMNE